jgi:4-alpha-glucanotransferase
VLSTRLFYFERHDTKLFKRPSLYPAPSMAQVTTHDLPTLAGYWSGRDIAVRAAIEPGFDAPQASSERTRDRALMIAALVDQKLLPADAEPDDVAIAALIAAVHAFLARTPACLAVVNLSDVVAMIDQFNLPGTTNEYPNWRLRLPMALEAIARSPGWMETAAAMRRERAVTRAAE